MLRVRWFTIVFLLFVVAPPPAILAQEATPILNPGAVATIEPAAVYDALLATSFPRELLPKGVAALEPYEWRDSNDPDLAGSIGGVIYADDDPFGSQLPTAIGYIVYPDASGPQAPLATAARFGEPAELLIDDRVVPAVLARLEDNVGLFTAIDNVFVYGMVPAGEGANHAAASLTEAGIAHLLELAATGNAAGNTAEALPGSGATMPGETAFLAVAAAPFPADEVPFEVGSLVVLPMHVSPEETAGGLLGAMLVRDVDRIYPYPLVIYRFYDGDSTALDAVSSAVRDAGMPAIAELPPEIEIPYPTTMIDHTNDTTEVLVHVGATIVIGNAPAGDLEDRHATAMTLAQIAVTHLEDVVGAESADRGESSADGGNGSAEQVYDALLTATFPEELLPDGVESLETSPWQDANDPDLAGSLGGVTYSHGDVLVGESVNTIAFVVFPDRTGAEASLGNSVTFVESLGEAPRPCAGVDAPSVVIEFVTANVCMAQLDNVAISGMVLALDQRPEEEKTAQATALTRAGIAFLRHIAEPGSE